ncbi:PAS domain S-box protein [Fulvivirga maritima]|uniref:sensor histidine kinase n=1 Tax=Fulvivirga maritima TaxID=2904247 RepID=UPI001F189B08|nr:PAS domain S-box protein [Fulvivirga maritima]UII28233.1 PAS domain S-box protein [Fulvivirga maritima]
MRNKLSFNIPATRAIHFKNFLVLILSLAIALYIDFITPLGLAAGSCFLIAFISTRGSESIIFPFLIAFTVSILIIIGAFISPMGLDRETALFNRCLTIIISWIMASLLFFKKISKLEFQEVSKELSTHATEIQEAHAALEATQKEVLNMTERTANYQRELEETQLILEMATEATEAGVWSWNTSTKIMTSDERMLLLFDLDLENKTNSARPFINRIHPEERKEVLEILKTSTEQNKSFQFDARIIDRFGNRKHVKTIGSVKANPQTNEKEITGLCLNITRDKLKDQALLESTERFQSAIEYSPIGIGILDLYGNWIQVNRALEEIFGYSADELYQFSFQDLTHPDDLEEDLQFVEEIIDGKIKSYQMDKRYYKKDGSIFWAQLNVSLLRSGNDVPQYFISQIQEITERKLAEQRIQDIVTERTQQLEVANKELEAFSYSVSHDLRSPLRSIHGFSQALLEDYSDKLDDTGKNYLNRVSSASIRMGRLIDDLLTLSRITRQDINITEIDLSDIANQIVSNLSQDYPKTNFTIQPNIIGNADRGLMSVVLENLLGNAAKYSGKEETPQVTLTMEKIEGKKTIIIEDNGVGFDMQYSSKLFGAFQRLHSDSEFDGTGIGLATVKRILNRHGEQVYAESTLNQGSKFYFTLN